MRSLPPRCSVSPTLNVQLMKDTTEPSGLPAVSIVVPRRNEARHIAACVQSLLEQERPPGGYEIIIADGLSDDGTRAILEKMSFVNPVLRVIDNPLRVTPCGMNCGIKAARG